MGFFYTNEDGKPPERPKSWKRFLPGPIRNFIEDPPETLMVIKVVFTLMAPIVGLLLGFVLVIVLLVVLANACSNG